MSSTIRSGAQDLRDYKERHGKAQTSNAKEIAKHKLPPEVFAAFQAKNPYRMLPKPNEELSQKDIPKYPTKAKLAKTKETAKGEAISGKGNVQFENVSKKDIKTSLPEIPMSKRFSSSSSGGLVNSRGSLKSYPVLSKPFHSSSMLRMKTSSSAHRVLKQSLENLKHQMKERRKNRVLLHASENADPSKLSENNVEGCELPIDKFIKKAWLVYMLCKVCFGLRRYAFEGGLDPKSFEAYIPQNFLQSKDQDTLQFFNPADYKALGEATWHRSAWESVLKPIGTRTLTDIQIIKTIMSSIKEFCDYTPIVQSEICQYVRYERFGKNRVVVRRGDLGYQYYYIYSGKLHVTYAKRGRQLYSRGASLKKLSRGDSFGEQALLAGVSRRRTATVICCENCELLTVDSDYFQITGLKDLLLARMEERENMIREFELFHSWSDEEIKELSDSAVTECHGYEKVVVSDARRNDFVYLCLKGRCEVLRVVDLTTSPLYGKTLEYQSVKRLQYLQHIVQKKRGITLRDDQILDALTWWPEYKYEDKYAELKQKYERNLSMSRDLSFTNFTNETGKFVRGSTINILRQLVVNHEEVQRAAVFADQNMSNVKNKIHAETTVINTMGTPLTFKRQDILNMHVDKETPHGVFMNVGELTRGSWFGIKDLWGTVTRSSLLSRGCSLVRIPKSKLYEMMDMNTVKRLRYCALTEQIPNDSELSREALSSMLWRGVSTEIGRQTFINQNLRTSTSNFVKSSKLCSTLADRNFAVPKYYKDKRSVQRARSNSASPKPAETASSRGCRSFISVPATFDTTDNEPARLVPPPHRMSNVVMTVLQEQKATAAKTTSTHLERQMETHRNSSRDWTSVPHSEITHSSQDFSRTENRAAQRSRKRNKKVRYMFLKAQQLISDANKSAAKAGFKENGSSCIPLTASDTDLSEIDLLNRCSLVTRRPSSSTPLHSHPKSKLPYAIPKARCRPRTTSGLAHNGTQAIRLVHGLYSPLYKSDVRRITTAFD